MTEINAVSVAVATAPRRSILSICANVDLVVLHWTSPG